MTNPRLKPYIRPVRRAAYRHGIPSEILAGVLGAESSFGQAPYRRNNSRFGLIYERQNLSDPAKDADVAASYLQRLRRQRGSWEAALRAYSGQGYGVAHVRQVVRAAGYRGGPRAGGSRSSTPGSPQAAPALSRSGADRSPERGAMLLNYIQSRDPLALLALKQVTAPSQSRATPRAPDSPPPTGTANFDGKPVAAWMVPALRYARAHGWRGRVNSGLRSHAEQSRLYAEMKAGRRAGPVAPPGRSNHEGANWPRGAVDVSDPAGLRRALGGYRGRKPRWFGPGDPVHFSGTGR